MEDDISKRLAVLGRFKNAGVSTAYLELHDPGIKMDGEKYSMLARCLLSDPGLSACTVVALAKQATDHALAGALTCVWMDSVLSIEEILNADAPYIEGLISNARGAIPDNTLRSLRCLYATIPDILIKRAVDTIDPTSGAITPGETTYQFCTVAEYQGLDLPNKIKVLAAVCHSPDRLALVARSVFMALASICKGGNVTDAWLGKRTENCEAIMIVIPSRGC